MPKFSIVIPVYKTPEKFLKEMLDSIVEQTYENWELCIADGSPAGESVETVLKKYAEKDARIRYQVLGKTAVSPEIRTPPLRWRKVISLYLQIMMTV